MPYSYIEREKPHSGHLHWIIIPIAVSYIQINRLDSKNSAKIWHFTALILGLFFCRQHGLCK